MSKPRARNKAPDGLVIPKHRYKLDAKTRAAIALSAKIPLATDAADALRPGKPKRRAKKARRSKARKRPT